MANASRASRASSEQMRVMRPPRGESRGVAGARAVHQQQQGAGQEAQRAHDRAGVRRGQVEVVARRGHDVAGHRRDAEGDRAGQVDHRDPPAAIARAADGVPREPAGDEEADRAERVGPPDQAVLLRQVDARVERAARAQVEEQGAGELDRARPPVDAVGPGRVEELQRRRAGEEDRAREEHGGVRDGADQMDEARERPDDEARRADREQHADPPGAVPWSPHAATLPSDARAAFTLIG